MPTPIQPPTKKSCLTTVAAHATHGLNFSNTSAMPRIHAQFTLED